MSFSIIRADVCHTAAIATIGKKSFRTAFGPLFRNKEELFEYLEKTYDPIKLTRSIKKENNIYFIAFLDEQPIGFTKVKINSLNENIESIAQMELQKIYVLPEYQGCGTGTSLLNQVKYLAKDTCPDYIWLDAYVSNERVIRFYQKNGFQKISKQYFTIGTQTFEYHIMGLPVAYRMAEAC